MNFYLINYYSQDNSENLDVIKVIKDISDDFIEVFPNTWYIATSEISNSIQNYLAESITGNQKILVTSSEGECSGVGLSKEVIEFVEKYTLYY